MTCDICPTSLVDGKVLHIEGMNLCPICYGDIMVLGYYFPEIDTAFGIKPDKHVITSNKNHGHPITESDINMVKWEMDNRSIWKELEE